MSSISTNSRCLQIAKQTASFMTMRVFVLSYLEWDCYWIINFTLVHEHWVTYIKPLRMIWVLKPHAHTHARAHTHGSGIGDYMQTLMTQLRSLLSALVPPLTSFSISLIWVGQELKKLNWIKNWINSKSVTPDFQKRQKSNLSEKRGLDPAARVCKQEGRLQEVFSDRPDNEKALLFDLEHSFRGGKDNITSSNVRTRAVNAAARALQIPTHLFDGSGRSDRGRLNPF